MPNLISRAQINSAPSPDFSIDTLRGEVLRLVSGRCNGDESDDTIRSQARAAWGELVAGLATAARQAEIEADQARAELEVLDVTPTQRAVVFGDAPAVLEWKER